MKTRLLFLTLIFVSTFAQANAVEDSLIANIGKKAKVIFYAENKADFNEIAKYDLNKLFAEVRKRSEKNFSNNEEVTLREADELKNREVNTTVSTKKWLKNMNLNLFMGASFAKGNLWKFYESQEIVSSKFGNVKLADTYSLRGNSSFMLGVSGTFDKQIYKRKRADISLRYGFGFDLIGSRLGTYKSPAVQKSDASQLPILYNMFLNDSLFKARGVIIWPYKNYYSPNISIQLVPTFNFLNRKGQKVLSVGIGLKASISLAGLGWKSRIFVKYDENPNYIYPQYKNLQAAVVANIGYKYINIFMQMQPEIGRAYYLNKPYYFDFGKQGTFGNYVIGLRFGK